MYKIFSLRLIKKKQVYQANNIFKGQFYLSIVIIFLNFNKYIIKYFKTTIIFIRG